MVCDGKYGEVTQETAWTTACDCYEFCAPANPNVQNVMFQRTAHDQCQCLDECQTQTNCGLESTCQIFNVERVSDCCGDDWTLGKAVEDIQEGELGEFYYSYVESREQVQGYDKVVTLDFLRGFSQVNGVCVPEFMCEEYSYSFGEVRTWCCRCGSSGGFGGDSVAGPTVLP